MTISCRACFACCWPAEQGRDRIPVTIRHTEGCTLWGMGVLLNTVQPAYKDPVCKDFPLIRLKWLGPKYLFSILCLYFHVYNIPVYKATLLISRLILVKHTFTPMIYMIYPLITLTKAYSVKLIVGSMIIGWKGRYLFAINNKCDCFI